MMFRSPVRWKSYNARKPTFASRTFRLDTCSSSCSPSVTVSSSTNSTSPYFCTGGQRSFRDNGTHSSSTSNLFQSSPSVSAVSERPISKSPSTEHWRGNGTFPSQDTTKGRHELIPFESRVVVDVAGGIVVVESLESRHANIFSSIMFGYTKKNDTLSCDILASGY